jgi:hypothetical protein
MIRDKFGCMGYIEDDSNREIYIHAVYSPKSLGDDLFLAQLLARKEGKSDIQPLAVVMNMSLLFVCNISPPIV